MIFDLISGQLSIVTFIIWAVSLVLAVSVHEFAHALAADKLGDNTPRLFGRLTLNPLAHLDPLGTLLILISGFGWGKPTPVNPLNMEDPHRDTAIVSLAGPVSNIILAILLALPIRLGLWWGIFLLPGIILNIGLAVFNLIPIFPLDGFKIVSGVLPMELAATWEQTARYGYILILFFVFFPLGNFSLLSGFVHPLSQKILSLIVGGFIPGL